MTRWVAVTGVTFFEAGRAVRLVGTVQDISDRKRAEEALRQADRRKDEFLATLADELRNPLAGVRGATELLKRFGDRVPPASAVDIIDRQTRQLAHLVDDLMDVSRIATGKIELRRTRRPARYHRPRRRGGATRLRAKPHHASYPDAGRPTLRRRRPGPTRADHR